jgi:hypothetical protein
MHISTAAACVVESLLHCDIHDASWEEPPLGTKAMTIRSRPIHCGFETLRHASEIARPTQGYRRLDVTNERMIARGTGTSSRLVRPTTMFAEFRAY